MEVETGYHMDGGPIDYQENGQYYDQGEYQEHEEQQEYHENQHHEETYEENYGEETNYEQHYEENEGYHEEYAEELEPAVEETDVEQEAVIRPDDVEKLLQLFLDYCWCEEGCFYRIRLAYRNAAHRKFRIRGSLFTLPHLRWKHHRIFCHADAKLYQNASECTIVVRVDVA